MKSRRKPGTGLSILLAVAMVVLFFVASVAVSFVFAVLLAEDQQQHAIGVNYGRVADNLPPPTRVVELIKSLKFRSVKIYDANPEVLRAFQGTNLRLSIMVTNQEVQQMADSTNFTDSWVQQNIAAYPSTKIETAIVGNEVLSDQSLKPIWIKLVPAMENLQNSLQKMGYGSKIKVTSSLAVDCLKVSYPPSEGAFKEEIATSIMLPMLKFLESTGSSFFINVYPYFAWLDQQQAIPLSYALLSEGATPVQDASGLFYSNLLDSQLDALVMAMTKLGYGGVKVAISETGWPSKGNSGASIENAAEYNRRLVLRILGKTNHKNQGTPKRPGRLINTFIFSLFNEDQKPGLATEKNWGLLYPNGTRVYDIDITGKTKYPSLSASNSSASSYFSMNSSSPGIQNMTTTSDSSSQNRTSSSPSIQNMTSSQNTTEFPRAVDPSLNSTRSFKNSTSGSSSSSSQKWCVFGNSSEVSLEMVQEAMDYACGAGRGDCASIQPGNDCYLPNLLQLHASYAFNSYWQKMKKSGGSCSFNGVAKLTSVDPSYGSCVYPVS